MNRKGQAQQMIDPTDAQTLYAAAKAALSTCPDCGYEPGGCVCYEYSDQWLADIRAGWQSRLDELYADDETSTNPTLSEMSKKD